MRIVLTFCLAFIALALLILFILGTKSNVSPAVESCRERGGILLRAYDGLVCIDRKTLV